ncbi:MAG: hypothetical protein AVDCRST_MAG71-2901, partial [uncultured Lysobacter sp.]
GRDCAEDERPERGWSEVGTRASQCDQYRGSRIGAAAPLAGIGLHRRRGGAGSRSRERLHALRRVVARSGVAAEL